LLQTTLDEGLEAVGGNRGFIALVDVDRGELVVQCTAGSGWDTEKTTKRLLLHTGEQKGITTFVAATGKPHRTGDVHNDPYYIPTFDDVQSEIAVPILDKLGRARGVLNVESPDRDAFEERHEAILMALANIASLGIAVNRHRNRERAFVEIGTELVSSIDIPTLISKVIKVAGDVLRFEDCSVFMLDRDRHTLTLEASRGPLKQEVGDATYRMGEGLTGWIAEHGLPIRVTDPRADPRWRGLHEEIPPEEMGAYLGVPIESRNGVIGVLRVLRKKSKFPWFQNEFTEDDQSVLISIASQVAAAIQNLRLMDRVVNAERMAAWGEMSARSAHMMGNRLFAIKGDLNELNYQLSQTASGGGSDSGGHGDPPLQDADAERERHLELVQSVQKGVFRLEEMLTEFRDFVMATQISLSEQDVNLLVKESIDEFFPKRSSVRLEVGLTPDLPIIQADSTKLKRCFAELIENAVSFQTDGGLLRLSTVPAASKEARDLCGLSSKKKYIRLEFADAGPGIPEDDKQKIFTPFFTSRAKGMGLGLSIVKGIIEAHRGGICEIGSEGTGARFVIFLPVER
jgi:signal transduction histidine kinase